MRVVVVGATGNVGTSTVQALAADPAITSIRGLARRRPALKIDKTEWAVADVCGTDLVPHFRGADAVVHLAWLFQPTHSPMITWRANALGSLRVFEAVAEAGVPALVYSSSVGTYSPGPKDLPGPNDPPGSRDPRGDENRGGENRGGENRGEESRGHRNGGHQNGGQRNGVDESWPTHGWPAASYGREKPYVERLLDIFEAEHPERRVVRLRPGFIFKREAAAEQRRLFAGPFVPGRLARPGLIPVVPDIPGLRFQALHASDAGQAFRLAVIDDDARGPYNIAADPVIGADELAELMGARKLPLPARGARAALRAAWTMGLVPASPDLLDLALNVPIMDTSRARSELGWMPEHTSMYALREFLAGLRSGAGMDTPPLAPGTGGPFRLRELVTGVGRRP
ncbi:NAD-dependent epimerase/dehydratase family protein [Actinomadura sp. 9N407]|uniref:NAD-dependent epimerase/dehydratase family protein n=1 Tax=Actinomadura sp. 9N407 TaxID=3375154 RepID=UPI003796DD55